MILTIGIEAASTNPNRSVQMFPPILTPFHTPSLF